MLVSASGCPVLLLGEPLQFPVEPFQNPLYTLSNLYQLLRFAIGIVGDAGVRGTAQQPRLFVGMILILIFAEVLGQTKTLISKIAY